jgi:O-antigen/teichoic acid export membrane protein
LVNTGLAVFFRPDFDVLRPTLRGWRPMLAFGGCNGVIAVLERAYEQLPYLALGRVMSMHEVGIYNRALNLAQLPQKVVLGGVFTLMLPVMASEVRAGRDVKATYLRAVAYITAVQWPALVMLAILTYPAVDILFGEQWSGAAPIVQLLALAALFAASAELNSATLMSIGGIRDIMWRTVVAVPFAGLLLCGAAAGFGIMAMALCFFVTIPFHEFLMLQAVQRRVGFAWRELGAILRQSAVVTALSASGPLALVAALGFRFDLSLGMAVPVGVLGAVGWLGGLWLTRHPLLGELQRAAALIGGSRLMARS